MRKVILSIFVSVDGYIEGPNGDMDWRIGDEEMQQYGAETLNSIDTMLLGRLSYELFIQFWPTATGDAPDKLNSLDKIVFSRTLTDAPWGKWSSAKIVKDHLVEEIAALKQQSGKDMALFAGASIAQSFMRLGLIDEYQLLVHPIVLGGGKPLFANLDKPFSLKLLRTRPLKNGIVILYYEPTKQ